MQKANSLDKCTRKKILKGALITLGGAIGAFLYAWLATELPIVEALKVAIVVEVIPVLVNIGREYRKGE